VNKKYQQMAPEMQNALVTKVVNENRAAIEPKLKALEQRVSSVLGVPAPAASPAARASGAAAPRSASPTAPAASAPSAAPPASAASRPRR
jgi:hypothetical protein